MNPKLPLRIFEVLFHTLLNTALEIRVMRGILSIRIKSDYVQLQLIKTTFRA